MASKVEMLQQDMVELYQLLQVYKRTCPTKVEEAGCIQQDLGARYRALYKQDINHVRNPRGAGRKKCCTEQEDQGIIGLRKAGRSFREIAREENCSIGRVQDVVKKCGVW